MAKPFYSLEEASQILGRDAEQVKSLAREGKLRELRDAGKIFYKADDVDRLAGRGDSSKTGTGEIILEAADDEMPSLTSAAGLGSGGTSIIGLEPVEEEKKKEDTVITSSGIGVFDEELEVDADPMAKTQITPTAIDDQVSLEGTGSGSGLLDLTREADDTSLGAELLDEIYPGEEEAAAEPRKRGTTRTRAVTAPAPAEIPVEEQAELEPGGEVLVPVVVATNDPAEGIFSGLLVAALIVVCVGATVAAGATQGFVPSFAETLSTNFLYFVLGVIVLLGIGAGIGWFVGKAMAPRRA